MCACGNLIHLGYRGLCFSGCLAFKWLIKAVVPKVFAKEPPLYTLVKHSLQTAILFSLSDTLKYLHCRHLCLCLPRHCTLFANSLFGLAIKLKYIYVVYIFGLVFHSFHWIPNVTFLQYSAKYIWLPNIRCILTCITATVRNPFFFFFYHCCFDFSQKYPC